MYVGKTLFAEVMAFVPWTRFARIVHRYGGNAGVRTLSCAEQFRALTTLGFTHVLRPSVQGRACATKPI